MNYYLPESKYPLSFRAEDAEKLGEHLRFRHSIEVVGMKRVGIGNFLRFFLNNPGIVSKYINHGENHLFVTIDLNDLIEREVYPFWILTLKRLVDRLSLSNVPLKIKQDSEELLEQSLVSHDLFVTIENVRKTLLMLVTSNILPTLFFLRFDRLSDAANDEFFANMQGLREATDHKLAFVFTSYRSLDEIFPMVLTRKLLTSFSHVMYIKGARGTDIETLLETFENNYSISLDQLLRKKLLSLCGGHVQYLHLSCIILQQKIKEQTIKASDLEELLCADERIILQSDEIWESFSKAEQEVLISITNKEKLNESDIERGKYLINTGVLIPHNNTYIFFSKLFEDFVLSNRFSEGDENIELTKKEKLLYNYLYQNIDNVSERDGIIHAVWPESEEFGVSDWTIDKLIARLRNKLKKHSSAYKIVTVKTRGYKLTTISE